MKKKKTILIMIITMLCIISIDIKAEEIGNIISGNIHSNMENLDNSGVWTQRNNGTLVEWFANDTNASYVNLETKNDLNMFSNAGKGYVIFSFAYYSSKGTGASSIYSHVISGVAIKDGSQLYACEIGNLEPYSDSGVQWKQATAKCYVNLDSTGLQRIRFTIPYAPRYSQINITIGRYATFVGASTPQSNQNVVNAIQSQNQELTGIKSAIQQQIQQEKTQHNEIMNEDLPQQSSESSVDSTEQEQAEQNIESVIDSLENEEQVQFNLNIESESNLFVWNLLTRILQTNQIIFSMVTTILLIGVIKLALGR